LPRVQTAAGRLNPDRDGELYSLRETLHWQYNLERSVSVSWTRDRDTEERQQPDNLRRMLDSLRTRKRLLLVEGGLEYRECFLADVSS